MDTSLPSSPIPLSDSIEPSVSNSSSSKTVELSSSSPSSSSSSTNSAASAPSCSSCSSSASHLLHLATESPSSPQQKPSRARSHSHSRAEDIMKLARMVGEDESNDLDGDHERGRPGGRFFSNEDDGLHTKQRSLFRRVWHWIGVRSQKFMGAKASEWLAVEASPSARAKGKSKVEFPNPCSTFGVGKRKGARSSPKSAGGANFGTLLTITTIFMVWAFRLWDIDRLKSDYSSIADLYWGPPASPPAIPSNVTVTYDHRAIIVNNKRRLLITGSIHYPRSSPGMWPYLFARAKAAGINTIDTYVFWSLHEPSPGIYDFETEAANLPLFLKLANEAGLFVALRIGPYVCAEFNNGGIPPWLLLVDGVKFRQYEPQFMHHMEAFIRTTVAVVEPFLIRNGGPIILLQMENEYKTFMWNYFPNGHRYIEWTAHLANSIDAGVPWFMCEQGEVRSVINTCNGYYCDHRISEMKRLFPQHPLMYTELWSGWFQLTWEPLPSRPGSDVAFSTARWIARGGTYVAYYMWHGGTNFGRYSGGPMMATSYDYDAPVNEYGFPHDPKHMLLADLHAVLLEFEDVIVGSEAVDAIQSPVLHTEIHVYWGHQKDKKSRAVAFLSNTHTTAAVVPFQGQKYIVPGWSVSVVVREHPNGGWRLAYSTAEKESELRSHRRNVAAATIGSNKVTVLDNCVHHPGSLPKDSTHKVKPVSMAYSIEPVVGVNSSPSIADGRISIVAPHPREQIRTTNDTTDFLWYIRSGVKLRRDSPAYVRGFSLSKSSSKREMIKIELSQDGVQDFSHYWLDGVYLGSLNFTGRVLHVPAAEVQPNEDGHTLSVLSVSMGIAHWNAHIEQNKKGFSPDTKIKVDGNDITAGTWTHVVGLVGEQTKWFNPARSANTRWIPATPTVTPAKANKGGMTWHKFTFKLADLCLPVVASDTSSRKPLTRHANDPLSSFALHIGGMGKGVAYVNGRHMGRYWTVKAASKSYIDGLPFGQHPSRPNATDLVCPPAGDPDCEYGAGYDEKRCRHGCGEVVQPFMHVPFDWMGDVQGEVGEVSVVLFEEVGGDPASVYISRIVG